MVNECFSVNLSEIESHGLSPVKRSKTKFFKVSLEYMKNFSANPPILVEWSLIFQIQADSLLGLRFESHLEHMIMMEKL